MLTVKGRRGRWGMSRSSKILIIIATAVLILAAVALVSFFYSGCNVSPDSCYDQPTSIQVTFGKVAASRSHDGRTYYSNLSISVDTSLGTDMFGVEVLNVTTSTPQLLPLGVPPCISSQGSGISGCNASSKGWYAVLVDASGAWQDSFPFPMNNSTTWSTGNVSVQTGDVLVVISPWPLAGTGDYLLLYPTSSAQDNNIDVNGQATL